MAVLLVLYGVKSMRKGEAQAPMHEPDVPGWVYRLGVDDCVSAMRQTHTNSDHQVRLHQDMVVLLQEIRDELRKRPHHS